MHIKKYLLMTTSLLAISSFNAYAFDYIPGKVHHPIHIKKIPISMRNLPSGLSPAQVKTAYGLDKVTAFGKGQVIAIVDAFDDPNIEADLATFNKAFNLPECTMLNKCFQKIYASGRKPKADAGWSGEIALDVEWAHAIAPLASIYLVEAKSDSLTDLFAGIKAAIKSGATVISMSWGGGEATSETKYDTIFQGTSAVFTASSGDSGYGVSYPAASPYVIAVGGTSLNVDASGNYVSETAWSGSGGGISQFETVPAYQQSYPIPNNPTLKRGIPDVSYNADPDTGFSFYNSMPDEDGQVGWGIVGGTSAGAPQWAALIAVANSVVRKSIPDMSTLIYKIAKHKYSLTFNDILSGSNGTCGYYCEAQPDYDYVTGLGTPKAQLLINMMISGG